ncbi:MAG TPA: cation diffusion facilitator family transporter [Flavipsychrobacter sp.]|nr:cation diffusion facilitator family transporter [Flavipsychrobacter sp.]
MPVRIQRYIAILSVVLFLGKLWAWYLTHSVTVLTDALESTVNVIAGFIGLYSIILSAKPRDIDHPYGHGKAEFISSAVEGSLIFIAGLMIIYEAIDQLIHPKPLHKLDVGIYIVAATGILNFFIGTYAVAQGKKMRSLILESAGKHLRVDAYSTFAIVAGLALIMFTKVQWLDSVVAMLIAIIILVTGYKLVRRSLSGIMDETDMQLLNDVIAYLQTNRRAQWIDLHNLRVMQYGDVMHLDAHMTLPWYYTVKDADAEIHVLEEMIKQHFDNKVEVFVHIDACQPYQCKLCAVANCMHRQAPFIAQHEWNRENVWYDSKHGKE